MTDEIRLSKSELPEGIISYTVIDKDALDRLIFKSNLDVSKAVLFAEKCGYVVRTDRKADA